MFFFAILLGTPPWVFVVLLVLLVAGISQTFPRQASLRRITVLPLVMLGLSLQGVITSFDPQPWGLLAWALGLVAVLLLVQGRTDLSAVGYSATTRRFDLPGSWLPLALMLGIFALKYGMGVSLALHPELRASAGFALATSLALGAFSGVFLGRALALWAVARREPQSARLA